ncbi:putative lysine--tRNA ligase [Medicago truncatula]|uniref:Putative lysine--tRNA ligase n=1 Tax=Medicago truncatula TaxID=3880 RepID=A2Q230_MEDTR|nr:hypothetical protein MtrDRAFT_AC149207g5v2 [Medicago truncatula]RHN72424.1 putative lysine--tRNA ligase [Medicago truncatula]
MGGYPSHIHISQNSSTIITLFHFIHLSNDESHSATSEDQDMDPMQYLENRLKHLALEKAKGKYLYPHKFHVTMSTDNTLRNMKV